MPSGFLTGLIKGFGDTAAQGRAEAAQLREDQFAREQKVLELLAGSADPDVAGAATTALLEHASGVKAPKGGFLSRLVGRPEDTIHPAVASVLALARSPRVLPATPVTTFDRGEEGPPPPPAPQAPTGSSAAMPPPPSPSTGPHVEPPPPPPMAPSAIRRGAPTLPGGETHVGPPTEVPRHLFYTEAEKKQADTKAAYLGQFQGKAEALRAVGVPEVEIQKTLQWDIGGRPPTSSTMPHAIPGVRPYQKENGQWYQLMVAPTGEFFELEVGDQTHATTRTVTDDEQDAAELFGAKYPGKTPADILRSLTPDEMATLHTTQRSRAVALSGAKSGAAAAAQNTAMGTRPMTPQQRFSNEQDLRDKFEKYVKEGRDAIRIGTDTTAAYREILTNLEEGKTLNAQSQLLQTAFNKLTDPSSVVRESEYERTAEGQSLFSRITGAIQRIKTGGAGLAKSEIDSLYGLIQQMVTNRKAFMINQARTTRQAATQYGLDISNILTPDVLQMIGEGGVSPPPAAPTGRGGGPPAAPSGPPPAPPASTIHVGSRVGSAVGQEYSGEVRTNAKGQLIGRLSDGTIVDLVLKDGKYYVK